MEKQCFYQKSVLHNSKKSRFIKELEVSSLLGILKIIPSLSKIPLLSDIWY